MQMFRFDSGTTKSELPRKQGKTIQWFRYTLLAANTTPSAEGVIGTSVPQSTTTVSATISEYSDFTSGSTLLVETDISQTETEHAKNLGYRAGLTNDSIARTEFDSAVATVGNNTLGASATAQDGRRAVAELRAVNVLPMDDGNFIGIIHPYILYDVKADNTAGGFMDVLKYANPQSLVSGGQGMLPGEEGKIDGIRLVTSTNVGTTGTAPNLQYYWYVIGRGAVGSVPLSGSGPSAVTDPTKQNFNVAVVRGGKPSIYDPEGKIGFVASYRFVQVYKILDATNYRYKIVKCDASLV